MKMNGKLNLIKIITRSLKGSMGADASDAVDSSGECFRFRREFRWFSRDSMSTRGSSPLLGPKQNISSMFNYIQRKNCTLEIKYVHAKLYNNLIRFKPEAPATAVVPSMRSGKFRAPC
jgi:hypothetical protein